jgi:hypothetical protein
MLKWSEKNKNKEKDKNKNKENDWLIDYRIDIEWTKSTFKSLVLTDGFSIQNLALPLFLLHPMRIELNSKLSLSEDLSILEFGNLQICCFVPLFHWLMSNL